MVGWRPGSSSKSPQVRPTKVWKKCVKKNTENRGVSAILRTYNFYIQENIRNDGDRENLNNLGGKNVSEIVHVDETELTWILPNIWHLHAFPREQELANMERGHVPSCSLNSSSIQNLFYSGTKTNRTVQVQPSCRHVGIPMWSWSLVSVVCMQREMALVEQWSSPN